ncbi:MAG: PQQ-binding-like beta-propeller repeat protein [Verrucomicrobia bacterium]|nr:PQQ-binding-like beta-propeller repeat protein [Verrucomicrobiota bacterium]
MKAPYFRLLLCVIAFHCTISFHAQEWTRFRGPNGSGLSDANTVPSKWTEADFNWKVELPGTGHSSPVIWGDRIFLTTTLENPAKIVVLCLRVGDGTLIWRHEFEFALFDKHQFNSFTSATPAVDAEYLYVPWSTPDRYTLRAFDHDGNTVWDRDLGPFKSQHGCGTSPVVVGDKVILGNDQLGQSCLFAFNRSTGDIVWKTERRSKVTAYSTPCVYTPDNGGVQLIFNSQAHGISALDPDTGRVLWEYADAFDKRSVSSPVIASGLIIGSCGSGGGGNYLVAVRPGDPQKHLQPQLAYQVKRSAPYVPCSVALDNMLFLWSDAGVVTCLKSLTGEVKWQERAGGTFFGSPVCVDKRLFCVSATGEVVVIEASDQFKVLARNDLGEPSHATPAISGGRMYVRTLSHLFSIGGRRKELSLN